MSILQAAARGNARSIQVATNASGTILLPRRMTYLTIMNAAALCYRSLLESHAWEQKNFKKKQQQKQQQQQQQQQWQKQQQQQQQQALAKAATANHLSQLALLTLLALFALLALLTLLTLLCFALLCFALLCIALLCFALHWTSSLGQVVRANHLSQLALLA